MKMPFGLDFMSIIVGMAIAYFLLPWALGMVGRARSAPAQEG